ncbi:M48 family metalloprotease [Mangrovicoccus algicola]|uniref:M48 family metalloprotease n=1 Tax=Mangrovicoccus algicola TaxID=2771008 RepID=A0A8J7CYW4_9RHOB|nr:M48 family metalloprotease [Mangrovicoccus algicola]MBE3637048.1 M48 family metalloprotease [Mangrovicoccus algicola]
MAKLGTASLLRRLAAVMVVLCLASGAQARSLIRDAGLEYALDTIALPVMTSADLWGGSVRVMIVNDMSLNAFVVDGRAVYVHAGLILRLSTPAQLQAVIAHELAHITNGHITRRSLNAESAGLYSGLGLALGVTAGILSGSPVAGAGLAYGTAGSARGVFLGHTREEESAADRSGMRFLARAGIDPSAMAEVMTLFAGQEDMSPSRQDAYLRSHPLSRDRLRAIRSYAEVLGPRTADQAMVDYWFARLQAKLGAYLRDPDYTFRRYPASDLSDAGRIARSLAQYKMGRAQAAWAELDPVLAARPEDAYLHELKGWIALESNRMDVALPAYRRAAKLAPKEPQVLAGLGKVLLAQGTKATDAEALAVLQSARSRDARDPGMLRDLAMAYARTGEPAMASLHTAERYALLGEYEDALIHARRAVAGLPVGAPGWARAQDIIDAAERETKNRRTRR